MRKIRGKAKGENSRMIFLAPNSNLKISLNPTCLDLLVSDQPISDALVPEVGDRIAGLALRHHFVVGSVAAKRKGENGGEANFREIIYGLTQCRDRKRSGPRIGRCPARAQLGHCPERSSREPIVLPRERPAHPCLGAEMSEIGRQERGGVNSMRVQNCTTNLFPIPPPHSPSTKMPGK